ncbi:MAG: hypothetical protein K2X46_00395 [Roseomonas sp.]|nr:hypothetical protein [Roseomonas sp.]
MSRPDSLAILRLLRRSELEAARQQAAAVFDRRQKAEHAVSTLAGALSGERRSAEPDSYAVWIPAAQARLDVLTGHLREQEAAAVAAQQRLVATKLAEQVIMDEQQRRKQAARRQRIARDQRLLDDL